MKKIEVENGYVKYKVPNLPEGMILLGDMGLSMKDLEDFSKQGGDGKVKDTTFFGNLLNSIDKFVVEINIDDDGEKITRYDQLLTPTYLNDILVPMGVDILGSIMPADKAKKKRSKARSST